MDAHDPGNVSDAAQPVNSLTEEEASRYDRQMRLWGIEAQQRCVIPGHTYCILDIDTISETECEMQQF